MNTPSGLGSTMSRTRKSFPGIWSFARTVYHRARYLYFGERGFQYALHPQIQLLSPTQWVGADRNDVGEQFFGYYDKTPWSPDTQKLLLHQPTDDGRVQIVVYDRTKGSVQIVASSAAWNVQQGSMAQWLPGSGGTAIIFNDVAERNLVARLVSLDGEAIRTIPWPIQVAHPNGHEALTLNYCRLDRLRPDYGYRVDAENFRADQPLTDDGIWWLDLHSGNAELRLTLRQLADHAPRPEMREAQHKVNHFYYAPDGRHFVFMHRWLGAAGKHSRLYVADANVSNPRLLLDDGMVSHYSWRDDDHVLAWAHTKDKGNRYYLINIHSGDREVVGEGVLDVYGDGHPTFSPDRRWILTDSYPNKARQRHLLLFNVKTQERIELGRFFAPWKFSGVIRCDLHPRWSPDGMCISVDSAHTGIRQSFVIDVRALVTSH